MQKNRVLIAVFEEFLASINTSFILAGGLDARYHSMEFWYLTDIS